MHASKGATPATADDASVDAALLASRALLGVVVRSLADALEVVTLPQFRVLVVLRNAGPLRTGALAEQLSINPSTFSRFVDRMVDGRWIERRSSPDSRREVLLDLTPQGARIVDEVVARRRDELGRILSGMSANDRETVQLGLETLAVAAGEPSASELLTLGV
jgi:DNA-binding MarR family transcriptional regulator